MAIVLALPAKAAIIGDRAGAEVRVAAWNGEGQAMFKIALTAFLTLAIVAPVMATSGPGCLVVVNVPGNDALNMRARPSANARIVDVLPPQTHGIIHLDAACRPASQPWASRWCPVTHYNGDRTTKGWVKARFVRDSDCP